MKILVSDLDGTLVRENKISLKDLEAINILKENGHKFIVATGRTFDGVNILAEKFKFTYDYLVLCNGSIVMNSKHEIIYKKSISNTLVLDILKHYLTVENIAIYLDNGINTYVPEGKYDDLLVDCYANSIKILNDQDLLSLTSEMQIIGINSVDKSMEKAEKIRNELLEKYGDYIEVYRNTYFLDIVPKGCSKGEGLSKLLKELDCELNRVYTIGDSFNDVSMFQLTENSYTFHHAEEAIKASTKNHVHYVHECVSHMLECLKIYKK